MRKHFLILMLMALLPLSGFAMDAIDLSTATNVVITLNRTQLDYTGNATAPVVTGLSVNEVDRTNLIEDNLVITFYKKTGADTYSEITEDKVRNAGDYALTLKGDGDLENPFTTDESAKVDFTILPGELDITLLDATKVYGDADPTILEYTWDDMTQLRGSDDVNNVIITLAFSATPRATGETVNTTTGYAYNAITATTPNYTVNVHGTPVLKITKRPLTGTYTGTLEKKYGADDPAFDKTKLTFTGWADFENTAAKKAAAITIADNATLSYEGTDANYPTTGDTPLTGKAAYPVSITGVTSANYALTLPAYGMKIRQRDINDAEVTVTAQSAEATYNAAKQLIPADKYSVIFQGNAATFDVKYYSTKERNTEAIAENNVKNAAKYYYQIEGKGNFSGVYSGVTAQNANGLVWEIKQKDLWIYALDDTKPYDGTEWATTSVNFEYSGLEGTDAVTTEATATIGTTLVPNSANVNTTGYDVTPVVAGVVIKNGETVVTDNYNIQALATGKLKITKAPLTLTAGDKALDLGYTNEQLATALAVATNVTVDGEVDGEDVAYGGDDTKGILDVIASGLDAALATTNNWDYANAGQYPAAITITWDTEDVPAVLKNYEITVNPGKFTVNGGVFTMIAKNVTVKYGQTIPDFDYLTSGNVKIKEGANVTYTVYKNNVAVTDYTEVGTYTIKIDEKTAEYLPANFTGINYAPGTLKIDPAPLTVVVADQTLSVGQAATALLQGDKYVTVTGVKEGEKVKLNIVAGTNFSTAAETVEPIENAITVVMPASADGYNNGNYTITGTGASITMGKLTVVPAATIVLNRPLRAAYNANPALDNAAEVIAAADAEKYDAAGAAATNMSLTNAWPYNKVKTAATNYTEETAKAYNAGLTGAVSEGDVKSPAVYNQVAAGTLTAGKKYYISATGEGEFTALGTEVSTGDNYWEKAVYTADEAADYNAGLFGAVNTTMVDPTTEVLYTDAEVNDHNATLPGAVAEGDTKKKNVTFGDFTMYAEKWYAMVLPFETSVAEVSQKFGYAIVDLLNTDNNQNAVSFKLHMQEIAANTPFIIKVYKQMDMNDVVFEDKTVVNPAAADLVKTDLFGNTFTGTYSAKNADWLAGQDYLFSVSETKNTYGPAANGATPAATSYLNPVCAYITYKNAQNANSHEAILYIEEPDGSTTAIREVNGQVVEGDVNGWYTINGVKLETVPTQKGIYINNGKKIVIK